MNRRADFPLLAANPGLRYLDSAATSQKPRVVLDAIVDFYENSNANPHRGAYALSVAATDRYDSARRDIARFIGLADADCLIFTRGTTEALNLVASSWGRQNVSSGDEIVVTALEHHANFVPWQQLAIEKGATLRICELTPDGQLDLDCLSGLLNSRTKIVAINHVSNALGTINPVSEIVEMVRRQSDAVIVCDGAQAAPHLQIDFDRLGPDFYAFSGHKMCGPMGIGCLASRRELLDAMPPYQMGGDMIEFVHDDSSSWNVLPHKFEAGTPNAADAVGLAAAVRYLEGIGMAEVLRHERVLVTEAYVRLSAIEGIRIYGPPPDRRSGVISFTMEDVHPHDLATILDGEDICIRAGHHCAQPLMRRLDVPATARASFYVYNDSADIDALLAGVARAREISLQVRYDGDAVADVGFSGRGCSISQASASMMTQLVKGKSVGDIESLRARFRDMVMGDADAGEDKALGSLRALGGVSKFPARVKCALLAWNALAQITQMRNTDNTDVKHR